MDTAEPSLRFKVSHVDAARFPYSRYAVPISELCRSAQIEDCGLLQFAFPTYVSVGRLASTVIERADEVDSFPGVSRFVTVTFQTPSARVPNGQEPDETVQVTSGDPALVALMILFPVNVPETLIVGVVNLVMLSVFEIPESDASARSGTDGVSMLVLFTTTPVKELLAADVTPASVCCAESEYVPF